ncbi:MAG: phosphoglycolate phosphatase [Candidatus Rokuibacteriota bacterium]|nr:MAG: phosphoglycolate phosphatase [Candidatus Rokubacteria bacterium]
MKALLLDLDDTLLDYSGGAEHCWTEACRAVAGTLDLVRLVEALTVSRRSFWDDPERQRRERVNMLRAWTQIAARALEAYGAPAPGLAAAIAAEFSARRRAVMALFPEALACLGVLRAAGVPLGLVTNGDATEQRWKIERCALAPFFGAIVIEGEVGAGKPDAIVYRTALKALGVAPGPDVWMVGDHLEFDVAGAQRLGLHGVWMDRAGAGLPAEATVRPDRIVRALDEVVRAFATISP